MFFMPAHFTFARAMIFGACSTPIDFREAVPEALDEGADAATEIDQHGILRQPRGGDEAAHLVARLVRRDVDDKRLEIVGEFVPVGPIHESLLLWSLGDRAGREKQVVDIQTYQTYVLTYDRANHRPPARGDL